MLVGIDIKSKIELSYFLQEDGEKMSIIDLFHIDYDNKEAITIDSKTNVYIDILPQKFRIDAVEFHKIIDVLYSYCIDTVVLTAVGNFEYECYQIYNI